MLKYILVYVTQSLGNIIVVVRPGFQVSAAPRHRLYCRPSVRTIATGSPPPPAHLNGTKKVTDLTAVGNMGLIAVLKIL